MKRISYVVFLLFIVVQGRVVSGADLLTGVTRLSCEALLCLSSPARPGACNPALSLLFRHQEDSPGRRLLQPD